MKIFLENRSDEAVYYEGKRLPLKKENKTTYSAEIPDGEGEAEIRIVRRSELSDKFWALFALLFWVIGIMGFFVAGMTNYFTRRRHKNFIRQENNI